MARTRIKICGIKDPDMAKAAADAGADAIGLVFVKDSPRHVTLEKAERVLSAIPPFVEPVALFVDANVNDVWSTVEALGLRTIQLHGGETPTYIERLIDHRIIKALSFKEQDVNAHVTEWQNAPANVAGLVWDTPPKSNGDLTGGSGVTFDWHAMAALKNENVLDGLPPTVLAGGLCAKNVTEAIDMIQPYSVDVSSGVESSRGVKCAKRIAAFCDAVRKADG